MRAIILAAGRGSRMAALTDHNPKCLIKFRNKTLLRWQIDALLAGGVSDIAIVTGYKCEQFIDIGYRQFHNPRWSSTNMVSSLSYASEWLTSEPCIVSYSDIFYEASAISALLASSFPISITYDPNWLKIWQARFKNPLDDAESFVINDKNIVLDIGDKCDDISSIQGQFMGLLKFTPAGWSSVVRLRDSLPPSTQDSMHMTGTLQHLISSNVTVHAIPYNGMWGELDSQHDLSVYT